MNLYKISKTDILLACWTSHSSAQNVEHKQKAGYCDCLSRTAVTNRKESTSGAVIFERHQPVRRIRAGAVVPNLCLSEGVHLRLAIEGKIHLYIIYFQIFWILEFLLKMQWIFVILRNLFVITNFRVTCSSVAMLKRYVVRKRLGILN